MSTSLAHRQGSGLVGEWSGVRSMVVNVAWQGNRQPEGIDGRRVLIVGYSHHCKPSEMDDPQLTVKLLKRVMDGDETHPFWASIMHYFRSEDRRDFWSRVGFINYVPGPIGGEDDMFAKATAEQVEGAADRLLDVMKRQDSDVAIVFSGKATLDLKSQLSAYRPEVTRLDLSEVPGIRADYIFDDLRLEKDGHPYRIVLAGHPQGAHRHTMEAMVTRVMAIQA